MAKKLELLFKKTPFYGPESQKEESEKKGKLDLKDDKEVSFSGRYVTRVVKTSPLTVMKRFVKPKRGSKSNIQSIAVQILRKICGNMCLEDILLLITPATDSGVKDRFKMHCFMLRTKKHLGVTSLTTRELELIEENHRSSNYVLLFSTRNIDLQDLAKNSPIQAEIFETAKTRPKAIRRAWYHGHAVDLLYRSSNKIRVGLTPEKNSYGLNSLKAPKIRVRLNDHSASDATDRMGPSKGYANLAQRRRLDYPGFGRRVFQPSIYHSHCLTSDCCLRTIHKVTSELFRKNLLQEAKRLNSLKHQAEQEESVINVIDNLEKVESIKEGSGDKSSVDQAKNSNENIVINEDLQDEANVIAKSEKIPEIYQSNVEQTPKSNKMRLEMARKERAQIDRVKAHQAGEREKECIKLARQAVIAYRNGKEREATILEVTISKSHEKKQATMNTSSNKCKKASKRSSLASMLNQTIHFDNHPSEDYDEVYQSDTESDLESQPDESTSIQILEELFFFKSFNQEPSLDIIKQLTENAKNAFLKGEVSSPELKHSFCQFARVIEAINIESYPQDKYLYMFFKFAEILSFKMFIRNEYNFPGFQSAKEPRCRLECYILDDRKDFIASVGILNRQLRMFRDLFPNVAKNMRYINDAFVLTDMPKTLTYCIRSLLPKDIFNLLGELTYEWIQQPSPVTVLARQLELNELLEQEKSQNSLF